MGISSCIVILTEKISVALGQTMLIPSRSSYRNDRISVRRRLIVVTLRVSYNTSVQFALLSVPFAVVIMPGITSPFFTSYFTNGEI